MKTELLTSKLRLVPVSALDLEIIYSFLRNENIKKYLCDNKDIEKEFVEDFITKSEILFREKGIGLWLIKPLNSSSPIGFCGFFKDDILELLFVVHPDFQNFGYATERISKVIEYFHQLNLHDDIYAKIDLPNLASHAVVSNIGMQEVGEEKNKITDGKIKVYKLS